MDALIKELDQKHDDFNGSFSDRAYKHSFNFAYAYIEILEKQPRIKAIIENDEKEIENKRLEIIARDISEDMKNELFFVAMTSSLSFCYDELYRDIYLPMRKFKAYPLTPPQDIIGETQIYPHFRLMASMGIVRLLIKFYQFFNVKVRKNLDSYTAIQKIIHNIRQEKYRVYFNTVHQTLIPHLLKLSTEKEADLPKVKDERIKIVLDHKIGLYRADNEKLLYPVKRRTKRFKLIKFLYSKDDCGIIELGEETNQDGEVIVKEVRKINHLFRKYLDVADDLIVHHHTSGYSLNKKSFSIKANP